MPSGETVQDRATAVLPGPWQRGWGLPTALPDPTPYADPLPSALVSGLPGFFRRRYCISHRFLLTSPRPARLVALHLDGAMVDSPHPSEMSPCPLIPELLAQASPSRCKSPRVPLSMINHLKDLPSCMNPTHHLSALPRRSSWLRLKIPASSCRGSSTLPCPTMGPW